MLTILFVLGLTSDMTILYGDDMFLMKMLSSKTTVLQFFEKGFCFPENLFQS